MKLAAYADYHPIMKFSYAYTMRQHRRLKWPLITGLLIVLGIFKEVNFIGPTFLRTVELRHFLADAVVVAKDTLQNFLGEPLVVGVGFFGSVVCRL